MIAKAAKKSRVHLRQDFIPNFEIRSILLISTFCLSATGAAFAQTADEAGLNDPAALSVAADRSEHPIDSNSLRAIQLNTRADSKSADAAFDRADVNRDGRLSREEAEHFPVLSQRFDVIDTNRDSFISREEFNQAVGN